MTRSQIESGEMVENMVVLCIGVDGRGRRDRTITLNEEIVEMKSEMRASFLSGQKLLEFMLLGVVLLLGMGSGPFAMLAFMSNRSIFRQVVLLFSFLMNS